MNKLSARPQEVGVGGSIPGLKKRSVRAMASRPIQNIHVPGVLFRREAGDNVHPLEKLACIRVCVCVCVTPATETKSEKTEIPSTSFRAKSIRVRSLASSIVVEWFPEMRPQKSRVQNLI